MKLTHLDAFVKTLGFPNTETYLKHAYLGECRPLDDVADELQIGVPKLRSILAFFRLEKPKRVIPVTLDQARRLGPDDIAKAHGCSRATAWRWKRIILTQAADAEAAWVADVPGAGEE